MLNTHFTGNSRDFVLVDGNTAHRIPVFQALANIEILALYFSASWCPPCQRFTPRLVEIYNTLKKLGKRFEVIFVSEDRSQEQFEEYYSHMPWLALPYGDDTGEQLKDKHLVASFPTVILFDSQGNVLSRNGYDILYKLGSDGYPWDASKLSVFNETNDEMMQLAGRKIKKKKLRKNDMLSQECLSSTENEQSYQLDIVNMEGIHDRGLENNENDDDNDSASNDDDDDDDDDDDGAVIGLGYLHDPRPFIANPIDCINDSTYSNYNEASGLAVVRTAAYATAAKAANLTTQMPADHRLRLYGALAEQPNALRYNLAASITTFRNSLAVWASFEPEEPDATGSSISQLPTKEPAYFSIWVLSTNKRSISKLIISDLSEKATPAMTSASSYCPDVVLPVTRKRLHCTGGDECSIVREPILRRRDQRLLSHCFHCDKIIFAKGIQISSAKSTSENSWLAYGLEQHEDTAVFVTVDHAELHLWRIVFPIDTNSTVNSRIEVLGIYPLPCIPISVDTSISNHVIIGGDDGAIYIIKLNLISREMSLIRTDTGKHVQAVLSLSDKLSMPLECLPKYHVSEVSAKKQSYMNSKFVYVAITSIGLVASCANSRKAALWAYSTLPSANSDILASLPITPAGKLVQSTIQSEQLELLEQNRCDNNTSNCMSTATISLLSKPMIIHNLHTKRLCMLRSHPLGFMSFAGKTVRIWHCYWNYTLGLPALDVIPIPNAIQECNLSTLAKPSIHVSLAAHSPTTLSCGAGSNLRTYVFNIPVVPASNILAKSFPSPFPSQAQDIVHPARMTLLTSDIGNPYFECNGQSSLTSNIVEEGESREGIAPTTIKCHYSDLQKSFLVSLTIEGFLRVFTSVSACAAGKKDVAELEQVKLLYSL